MILQTTPPNTSYWMKLTEIQRLGNFHMVCT